MNDNWVDDILYECGHVETPRSWIWWSLIAAISAVSANYSLRTLKGAVLYRPNLYVMLLGESGLGKGFGVNLSKLLVQNADSTRVIAGRSSIQAIVSELAKTKSRPNGKDPISDSRGFVVNGELSSAIISDVDALSILTDLYDGHYNPEWDNLLKVSGREKLKRPYIVTLFGSSPEHFYDKIPEANIGGGYIARNLMVYEEKRFQNVDLLDGDSDEKTDLIKDYLIPKYSPHLIKISSHEGSIKYDGDAKEVFNIWRRNWRETQQKDKTGFSNRVPDHVLKTAMCLVLARYETDLTISGDEMTTAIEKVTNLVYSNKLTSKSKNSESSLASHTNTVVDLLIAAENNQLPRKLLLSRCYPYGLCDVATLDQIISNLLELEWVERERHLAGNKTDWIIKLSGKPLEELKAWRAKQEKEKK